MRVPLFYAAGVWLGGLIATAVAIGLLRRAAVVDVPNERSSHSRATIRGAGIGVAICGVAAAVTAGILEQPVMFVVGTFTAMYAALGFLDDLRGLRVAIRLPSQLVVAFGVVVALGAPPALWVPGLGVVFVAGYVNAFNFMDGINGISALHALGIGITWTVAGWLGDVPVAVIAGGVAAASALAFLPFNLPRAKAFLGDVGSYYFGGWLAVSALVLIDRLHPLVVLLPLAPYLADTAWTLLRRVRRGEVWYEAHREHVYQRLVQAGWTHTQTSIVMGTLTLFCGVVGFLGAELSGGMLALPVAVAGIACAAYLALPGIIGEEVTPA